MLFLGRGDQAEGTVAVLIVVPVDEFVGPLSGVVEVVEAAWGGGWYLALRKKASACGLLLLTRGRECECECEGVMPSWCMRSRTVTALRGLSLCGKLSLLQRAPEFAAGEGIIPFTQIKLASERSAWAGFYRNLLLLLASGPIGPTI